MKAAWYSKNGNARDVLALGELPTPLPGPGEVRVKLRTSGINPSDVKSRLRRPFSAEKIVPHSDGGGIIDAVGPGTPGDRIGQRVWLWNAQWHRAMGTACEYIALPQHQAVVLPDGVDFDAAACLGIPALTAMHAINRAGPLEGTTVLVTGAANAVGHYVTQLAVLRGATVIGTVGSAAREAHALAGGAAHVIHYKTEAVAERIKQLTNGRGVDAIIDMDFSSTSKWLPEGILKAHGCLVCYGSNDTGKLPVDYLSLAWGGFNLHFFLVYDLLPEQRAIAIEELTRLLERNALKHSVAHAFGLEEIASAHELVESGQAIGNVLIRL